MQVNKSFIKNIFPYVLLIIISLTLIGDIFDSGYLTHSDNIAHLLETEYLKEKLLSEGKISGWYPYVFAGIPIFVYTPILGYWLILLISAIPLISINLAYKIVVLISFVGPSLAIYSLMKNKVSKFASFIPALALLFQHEYQSFIIMGMWTSGIAIILLFVLYKYLEHNKENFNIKNSLIAGLIISLTILVHSFIATASVIITINYFITKRIHKEKFTKILYLLTIIGITSLLLSLFYIIPIIETSDWPLKGTSYGLGNSLKEIITTEIGMFLSLKPSQAPIIGIMSGQIKPHIIPLIKSIINNIPMLVFNILVATGLIIYLKERKKEKATFTYDFALLNILTLLIVGSGFWYLLDPLKNIPILGTLLPYRFVYIARFIAGIFAAYGLSQMWKKIQFNQYIKALIMLLIIVPIILLFNNYKLNEKLTETTQETTVFREATEIFSWLKNNVNPRETRVFDQNSYVNIRDGSITKQNLILALGPKYTEIQFLTSWVTSIYPTEKYLKAESIYLFNKTTEKISIDEIQFYLKKYNAKYIITSENILRNKLENSEKFKEKYKTEHFSIFNLVDYNPSWIESEKPVEYKLEQKNTDKFQIRITNFYENNLATIKIAFHPYWKAKITETGENIKLKNNKYELIELNLPKGNYNIVFTFGNKLKLYQIAQIPLILLFIGVLIILKRKAY